MAEKKVEATEISVEERLKALYTLQTIMSEIDKYTILRGELPGEVQDLEDEIMGLQTRLQNYETEISNLQAEIVKYNEAIATSTANRARFQEQLNNVRNNREFDHLSKEVEYESLEIELAEKRIRECNAMIERKKEEQEKTNANINEKNTILTEKKEELDSIIVETKQEVERLREEAKNIETKIEPRLLQAFKRIRKNARNGLAVVYIERDACGGCFNKIPAQRQLDIRLRKKIIVCEHCGRILVDPELAGVVE
ncbi:MAG: C4-type zinc ribbon domain-containing protein [Paludibacteraceae bacterium]|jgi:predicted  nucleic acid-binding Zn-ribbon protein|nr:C4-type zinc ribbon domain-containing protein [Paludibacteraceae bacterium]